MRREQLDQLSDNLIALALRRFLGLRGQRQLRKPPTTGELLVWLRVLALALETQPEALDRLSGEDLEDLPYLHVLLEDHRDIDDLAQPGID